MVLDVAGQVHGAAAVHGAVHLHVAVDGVQVFLLVLQEDRKSPLNRDQLVYEYANVSRVTSGSRYQDDHLATWTKPSEKYTQRQGHTVAGQRCSN